MTTTLLKEVPLDLTRTARDISVTERNSFKSCHRAWYLQTIENLEPRGVRNWAFDFGTGIHAGLEAYYKTVGKLRVNDFIYANPLEAALDAFESWYDDTDKDIKQADLGAFESELRNELLGYLDLGKGMLEYYHKYAQVEDNFVVCAVEGVWTELGLELLGGKLKPPYGKSAHPVLHESGRFLVPIVNPTTKHCLIRRPVLSARLDLIVYDRRPGFRGFWIDDHKTSSSSPSDRGVDMDDQVTGYSYTFWRHTGIVPRGTTFNYLVKHLPKPPREIQAGLSTAKDQLTIPELYWEALEAHDLVKGSRILSEKHAECYKSLLAYGWGRFFRRISVQRNEHELKMFEMRLVQEYKDIMDVFKNPGDKAYPHLSQYNCPGCPVMPICQAIEDGSDYEDVIENRFQQAKDRKAK